MTRLGDRAAMRIGAQLSTPFTGHPHGSQPRTTLFGEEIRNVST
jgi:hypothetical protein